MEPDEEIKEMVDSYSVSIAPLINEVIGKSSDEMTRKQEKSGESPLGHFIADAAASCYEDGFCLCEFRGNSC